MGMAASQARLLSLTARLHDVEFEAQSIQQAKLALADQEDAVYQKYLEALDATCITGTMMQGTNQVTIPATFQNLCGGWENMLSVGTTGKAFGLVNQSTGKLYVNENIYKAYNAYDGSDDDEFALKMLGYTDSEIEAYIKHRDTKGTFYPLSDSEGSTASIGLKRVDPNTDAYSDKNTYYIKNAETGGFEECTDMSIYTEQNESGDVLFDPDKCNVEIYSAIPEDDTTTTPDTTIIDVNAMNEKLKSAEGQYYQNTFIMIQECGGCEIIDSNCKNNSEWLSSAVASGTVGIFILSEDTTDPDGYKFEQTSTGGDIPLSDTAVSSIDSTELKKAEVEYNKDLSAINKKDTQFDLALEELETERTSITTELESLRTVIDDNIERTFGVFS